MSECVGFNILLDTQYRSFRGWFFQAVPQKLNMKRKRQKRPKLEIVRTRHYEYAHVTVMVVLTIFPVILQTVINLRMLHIGGRGESGITRG